MPGGPPGWTLPCAVHRPKEVDRRQEGVGDDVLDAGGGSRGGDATGGGGDWCLWKMSKAGACCGNRLHNMDVHRTWNSGGLGDHGRN